MFDDIYEKIKEYDNIVIVRHVGVDPDALASQTALRDSIKLTFPKKKVYALGNINTRFDYLPKLDKVEEIDNALLIVVDTPDKKRVDFSWNIEIKDSIKIDHHPFIEKFCNLEYIDEKATSASEIILEILNNTPLLKNENIAKTIYTGITSDTNRFMFNANSKIFELVSNLLKEYNFDITEVYNNLYNRPLSEVRLQGYISSNMIVTKNGLGYIKILKKTLDDMEVDVGSAGNMVNSFNYINEIIAWVIVTEDVKNKTFKVNIRSRGPVINSVAEKYNGGGHKLASGARINNMETVDKLLEELDDTCRLYNNEKEAIL